jgi:serine/threonine protein kinase
MLLGKSYDNKIDVWALGILLYEMVHGDAPYGEDTPIAEKMEAIKNNKEFIYDASLSSELTDLIKSILQQNPVDRISMASIFTHPWMKMFEQNYGISIESFVGQNTRDASSKKSEVNSIADSDSHKSEYSTKSSNETGIFTKKENKKRELFQDKSTINFGGPDGKFDDYF